MNIEALYELMFDNVQDAIFLVDVDHTGDQPTFTYRRINHSYEEKTGIPNEEMAGNTPREQFDAEMAEELNDNYRRCVEEGQTLRYVEQLDLPNGSGTWKTRLTPLVKEDRVEAILGVTRDITEDMNRRRDLIFFREAMNQNPDEIYFLDPETAQFTEVTDSVEEMLGYTRQELLKMRAHDVNPNIGEEIIWSEHVQELKNSGPKTVETTHRRKDGSEFPVEIHVKYIEVQGTGRVIATARDITERKEAEQRIKSQEAFLSTINDQLPGVTFQFRRDPDGSYSFPYMSKGLYELCGVSNQTAMRDAGIVFDALHPDDLDEVVASIEDSAEQLKRWRMEARAKHPEYGLHWLRASSVPEQKVDGSVVWSGVMIDVTEEKKNEQALHDQKIRFQTLFDESPIGLTEEDWSGIRTHLEQLDRPSSTDLRDYLEEHPKCVRDAIQKAEIVLANESMVDLVGADDRQQLMNEWERLATEASYECIRNELAGLWNGVRSISSVLTFRRFDGEERHLLRDLRVVPGHEDDWSRVFVSSRDITERKRMEQSLRESEQRYRTLFEKVNESFLIVSFEDVILEANNNACELLGYSRDELIGLGLDRVIPSELLEETGNDGIVRSRMSEQGRSMMYSYLQHRDSTRIPVEVSRAPIQFGPEDAVVLSIRDRSELEQVRQKNQRKSTFVSQVTHDLRTPLNSITGMGTLLMDTDLTGEQQNYLQTILNAARNMERLTNDILDLNRIERGEMILENEPFHVQRLLGEVISLYSQEVANRNVMLSSQVSEEVPERLVGDPDRLKQILYNLVDNAIKHTHEGSIQIAVDLYEREDTSIRLSFSVSDTGKGIPEAELDDIFEEHRQLDPAPTGSGQGLGIGLAICRNLVDMMNGDIRVDSTVGEGTTFTFRVELEEADVEKESASVALNEVNVLLVEDNDMVRNVFRTYLESQDVNIDECTTGADAIDQLTDPQGPGYDVVFLDRRLGDMTGEEVLNRVADTTNVVEPEQIYIVTGDPAETVHSHLDSMTCAGVLEKPVEESSLINAISSVVLEQSRRNEKKQVETLKQQLKSRTPESLHVLVADDDQNTRTLLKELLDPVVEEFTSVSDGEDAVEKRFDTCPHIILMDLEMPEVDGLEATELIREQERERNLSPVPIITQTAKAMKHVETQCLNAGADAFMRKPINQRRLYRTVLDVMESAGTH